MRGRVGRRIAPATIVLLVLLSVAAAPPVLWMVQPDRAEHFYRYLSTRVQDGSFWGPETRAGWVKSPENPVLGGPLGTVFDVALLKEGGAYRMWFSWRPEESIALAESADGIRWTEPAIVLRPNRASGWEDSVNRPVVVRRPDGYHMWYTGQAGGRSWIGYARSADGITWTRTGDVPVLSPEREWEGVAVMCPHVLYDDQKGIYRMWYSAGEQNEPDAIGYATSRDGRNWSKAPGPVLAPDRNHAWESHKVTGSQVVYLDGWYYMFYIGFRAMDIAAIGLARSADGIAGWEKHPQNPIIRRGSGWGSWDRDSVYKPFAVLDGDRWLLWYNGRRAGFEQIGVAFHEGRRPGFDSP